jgi:hypothetical protein
MARSGGVVVIARQRAGTRQQAAGFVLGRSRGVACNRPHAKTARIPTWGGRVPAGHRIGSSSG